jgi:hypothetical protein
MHEVPRAQTPLLALDEQQALATEHEEVLLDSLRVVVAVRLAGLDHRHVDPDVPEMQVGRLEAAVRAEVRMIPPGAVGDVDDEPPARSRSEARLAFLELSFLDHQLLLLDNIAQP